MQFDGRGSKILVVDHDRTTLEMLQIRLDVAGYHPMGARSAHAALEILGASRPDAVILERHLVGMDGMELLKAMSHMPARPAPVLLVGRNIAAEDVRAGVALGVRDVLAKPFGGAAVLERLSRMLKKGAPTPVMAMAPAPASGLSPVYLNV